MTEESLAVDTDREDSNEEFESAFAEFASGNHQEMDNLDVTNQDDDSQDDENQDDGQGEEEQQGNQVNEAEQLRQQLAALQKERDELEHSFKSQVGRVSALQKKLDERKEPEVKDDSENEDDEDLNNFIADFPEIAKPLLKLVEKKYGKTVAEVDKRMEPITNAQKQEEERSQYIAEQVNIMNTFFEGWDETIKTPEYKDWLESQPEDVKVKANSIHAKDYGFLIRKFESRNVNEKKDKALELTQRRQQKLAANVTIPSKGESRKPIAPDDFDSAWSYYASKKQR